MQDKETGSEWSHILGESMAGPLKGTQLDVIPSTMTNWQAWKRMHPETTVTMLPKTARMFRSEMMGDGSGFGVGLVLGGKPAFWRFDHLMKLPVVNDKLSERPLVVYFQQASQTPFVWGRTLVAVDQEDSEVAGTSDKDLLAEPVVLTFVETAQGVQDAETQSSWDLEKGVSVAGALRGRKLAPLPGIVSFEHSWRRFHPKTVDWLPSE